MRKGQRFPVLVLVFVLTGIQRIVDAQSTSRPANATRAINTSDYRLIINTTNGSTQVYPPSLAVRSMQLDSCPDANWKHGMLYKSNPEDIDPFNWDDSEWQNYLTKNAIRAAILSLAFLIIGLAALIFAVIWRLVQWCVGCGHCHRTCAVGSQDNRFLKDTKHRYLKAWAYLLIAGALGMVVWGMLALDRQLLTSFWDAFIGTRDYVASIRNNLEQMETNLMGTAATKLSNISQVVNTTVNSTQLGNILQVSMDSTAVQGQINKVHDLVDPFNSAVSKAMVGFATLATQLGIPGTASSSRRQLTQSANSLNILNDLLAALKSSLPVLQTADDFRAGVQSQLQDLEAKLKAVQSAATLPKGSPKVADLKNSLNGTALNDWDVQLQQIATGMQVYIVSRTSSALNATKWACDNVTAVISDLAPAAVDALHIQRAQVALQIGNSSMLSALKALRMQLVSINRDVIDLSSWVVYLDNGTEIGVLSLSNLLLEGLSDYVFNDTTLSTVTNSSRIPTTNVTTFLRAARGVSSLSSNMSLSAGEMSNAVAALQTVLTGGPDVSASASRVSSTLRLTLVDLASNISDVSSALKAYENNPSTTTASALRSAAGSAATVVNTTASSFAAPLLNMQQVVTDLQLAMEKLDMLASSFVTSRSSMLSMLQALGTEIARYEMGLANLADVMGMLPDGAAAKQAITSRAIVLQSRVADAVGSAQDTLRSASAVVQSASSDIESEIVQWGDDIINDHRKSSDKANGLAYSAAMGAWGLGALLLLLLALSIHLNWPGGLVCIGMLLLVYLVLTQVLTSVVSLGLGVMRDGCRDAELVTMRQLAEHAHKPQLLVAYSYYIYRVPSTSAMMLQSAFGLNVSDLRLQLSSVNQTMLDRVYNIYTLRGKTAALADDLREEVTNTRNLFESTLFQVRYEAVNLLYANTKSLICCEAGNLAFYEWCALTAMAALSFGALVSAAYFLARMDMVRQREDSCCSCCSCACYGYIADEEGQQEHKLVKEAKKRQEIQGSNHLYGSAHKSDSDGGRKSSGKSHGAPPSMSFAAGAAHTKKGEAYGPPRSRSMKYGVDYTSEGQQASPRKQESARF